MQNMFISKDFYLCAFLLVRGCELISHSIKNGSTQFNFVDSQHLQELIQTYYFNQDNNVNGLTYANKIKALKSIIHQAKNSDSNSTSISNTEELNNGFVNKYRINQ